ncbi:hypothetical protein ACVIHI_004935 [Bradyrhizobium sp. USDA 4524]|uniref:hypothetical protein n=1 Tax=unclassified Bradyrhizobium TaxID=2631580 RepID=UPI0020A1C020|nr:MULTISPECIES: hypothetical protein [unclassified Bradyrhizobium]MCP1842146.1 hypothetical protein [Bradyrhizobium sp. USDA 4538]MCP1902710.1 hypothetical protein [Bradyrhizobium sp. USDA 4537]MCP1991633.1 hypothetical protein [Bradyrhizobium sp. USDA 4539]
MNCYSGSSWKDAYEALPLEKRHWVEMVAFETIARTFEKFGGSVAASSGLALALDPASQLLECYEVYLQRALRYQLGQGLVKDWSDQDLARTLAWKAAKEVLDHLRKIRAGLVKPNRSRINHRESDEDHKYLVANLISHLRSTKRKAGRDAAVLLEYVWQHSHVLTETPKRRVSFKVQSIAAGLTKLRNEKWDGNRVQRAKVFAIKELSQFQGSSMDEIVDFVSLKKA